MVHVGKEHLQSMERRTVSNEYHIEETIWKAPRKEIKPSHLFVCQPDVGEHKDPRRVLLVAVPGMGKTMMCYKLLNDILYKELFRSEKEYVTPFLLKFWEMNLLTENVTLKELLLDNGPMYGDEYDWQDTLWKHLKDHENQIVVMLDGFDECSNFTEKHRTLISNEHKPMPVQQVVYNIIAGRFLPQSNVFITSRPHSIEKLRKGGREVIDRYVELEGLHPPKLRELIKNKLEKFPILCKSFLDYIDRNISIMQFVLRPSTCCLPTGVCHGYTPKGYALASTSYA